jgi:hypothetical protein
MAESDPNPSSADEIPEPLLRDAGERISWACGRYDAGLEEMALQIAIAAKPLFHGVADKEAIIAKHDRISPICLRSTTSFGFNEGNRFGFIMLAPTKRGWHPELTKAKRQDDIPLEIWWRKEPILELPLKPAKVVTRQQLVLAATGDFADANSLSREDYQFLEDGMRTQVQVRFKGETAMQLVALKSAHLAMLRQIGHEILASEDLRKLAGLVPGQKIFGSPLPPRINVDLEMGRYVKAFGGQLGLDLFGHSPDFANADYVFPQDNVIAELKCLTDDKSEDEDLQKKLEELFELAIRNGHIPDPGPGRVLMETKGTPLAFQRQVYKLISKSLKRRLAKANKQIKQTKARLNRPDALGLVLLCNDGNFRLEPAQWVHAVKVALGNDFSSINSVVQFTVNMLSTTPIMGQHANLWMSGSRPGFTAVSDEFIHRFGEGWAKHVGQIIGRPVGFGGTLDVKNLESLKFDRQFFRDLGK